MIRGGLNVPSDVKILPKGTQTIRYRQGALRHFLAMLMMSGCSYALDFNGVHPQGVDGDSLESFRPIGEVQRGEMPALHAQC
jgi:hypothetical protein